jgi:formylglycine-generating enzyme required for sulfatase activity
MIRLFCFALVVSLASDFPVIAQEKEPPKDFTNSIGMKFVWIPPGNFMMGRPNDERPMVADETPLHKVTLTKGFYLGVHLVTQKQWQDVMGNNPSKFIGENLPVETVSWNDCQQLVKKLQEKEAKDKKTYRLPTEAEWEYSCRAGTTTAYHFGATMTTDQANFRGDLTGGVFRDKTTPVDQFPANAWGLHDMHGNLRQWCQDSYGFYPKGDVVDPQGGKVGKKQKFVRSVLRGGCWIFERDLCRAACRFSEDPAHRSYIIGLRVCFPLD